MRLRHTDRQVTKAVARIQFDFFFGFGGKVHPIRAINFTSDDFDFLCDGQIERVQELEIVGFVGGGNDGISEVG